MVPIAPLPPGAMEEATVRISRPAEPALALEHTREELDELQSGPDPSGVDRMERMKATEAVRRLAAACEPEMAWHTSWSSKMNISWRT